jgi:photosystem II stability/assembly factor-like uncharacterized protein
MRWTCSKKWGRANRSNEFREESRQAQTQQLSENGENFILVSTINGETFSSLHFTTTGDIGSVEQ